MAIDITSANSSVHIIVPAYYPSGFYAEDYAAEDMFDTAALQNAEEIMSADGKYHAGFVFNTVDFTLNLNAASATGIIMDDWMAAERAAIAKFPCNMVIAIPAMKIKYNFVNGILYSWMPTPPAKRIMQPRPAVLHFESVTRSAM